jgi:TPR repeat protein
MFPPTLLDFSTLLARAGEGDAHAQLELANRYSWGTGGVAQDEREAFRWYSRAASQGDLTAEKMVAISYHTGDGVPKNPERAVASFQKLEDKGYDCSFWLAECYYEGSGVVKDLPRAEYWYKLGVVRGDMGARAGLAKVRRELKSQSHTMPTE